MLGSHGLSWIWGTFWSAEQGYILAVSHNGQKAPDSPFQGLSPSYSLIVSLTNQHPSLGQGKKPLRAVAHLQPECFYLGTLQFSCRRQLVSSCILFYQRNTGILTAFSVLRTLTGGKTGPRSSADCFVFLFLLVYPGIYCLGHQHPAHPHIRLVEGLRWEPIQVLPASHLHPHAARPMHCDPSKSRLQFALHPAQTPSNQEGLGEGEVRQVCPAQCNRGVFEWGDLQQRLMEPQGWQRISKRYRHFYKGVSYS